jgi:hypothetical protein
MVGLLMIWLRCGLLLFVAVDRASESGNLSLEGGVVGHARDDG